MGEKYVLYPPLPFTTRGSFRSVYNDLIPHSERRRVLWPRLAAIIEPSSGHIGMTKPLLDLSDIGLVGEGIRRGRGSHRMHTEAADLAT